MQPRVPSPVSGVDIMALPLSTQEGFVLSRVDGSSSVEDISIMVGIAQQELLGILERLAELGAVELSWRPKNTRAKPAAQPSRAQPKAKPEAGSDGAPDVHFTRAAPRYDPRELDVDCDVPAEKRKRILDAYHALEGRNHYQLLGVAYDAERSEIRSRYFELSKVFHPDSMFGKNLGDFGPKMELVFKRLTEAYEVLGKKKRRVEYDEYLGSMRATNQVRQTLQEVEQAAENIRRSSVPSTGNVGVRPPTEALRAPPTPGGAATHGSAVSSGAAGGNGAATATASAPARTPLSTAERRARVRKRLRQGLRSASTRPPPPEPAAEPKAPADRDSMIDGLRQSIRASSAATAAVSAAAADESPHLERARKAEAAGEPMVAAAELQLALAIDPDNETLRTEYERLSKVVARLLADNYEKQAVYEEKTGNWAAAATSWVRVVGGRPESDGAARSAAEAMVKASGDLQKAQKYARMAVEVGGETLPNLTTLARVYLAAGLKAEARRELERAANLDPDDEMVKNLTREAR